MPTAVACILPASAVIIMQMMQTAHVAQVHDPASGMIAIGPALILISLLKVLSVCVLSVYVARALIARQQPIALLDTGPSDMALFKILLLNIVVAAGFLAGLSFITSDSFLIVAQCGISKASAKAVLVSLVVLSVISSGRTVFRDIARSISSMAAEGLCGSEMRSANRLFLKGFYRASLSWIMPALAAHLFLSKWFQHTGGAVGLLAFADALTVLAVAAGGGRAMVLAHNRAVTGLAAPVCQCAISR